MGDFDSIVERQIREASARGAFDELPGSGQPLPGKGRRDGPGWWVRSFLERERAGDRATQRFEALERVVGTLWKLSSEGQVRQRLETVNQEMAKVNAMLPQDARRDLFDPEAVVAAWRQMTRARLERDH